jgi:hypothetical protein
VLGAQRTFTGGKWARSVPSRCVAPARLLCMWLQMLIPPTAGVTLGRWLQQHNLPVLQVRAWASPHHTSLLQGVARCAPSRLRPPGMQYGTRAAAQPELQLCASRRADLASVVAG